MNQFSTYEFAVDQKIEGRWLLARICLVTFYILVGAGILLAGIRTRLFVPLIALTPVLIWLLVFITWRYTAVEYEYSITSGTLTFARIYGNRTRRVVLELDLRQVSRIAPLEDETEAQKAAAWHPEREYSAISSLKAPDIYFILFEHNDRRAKEKRRAILYFEATNRALQICRFYNPSATLLRKLSR